MEINENFREFIELFERFSTSSSACRSVPFYGFYILRTLVIFHISKALPFSYQTLRRKAWDIIFHHFQSLGLFGRKRSFPRLGLLKFLWFFNCECSRKRIKMRIIKNRREAARKINELDDEKKWCHARWAGNNVEEFFIFLD